MDSHINTPFASIIYFYDDCIIMLVMLVFGDRLLKVQSRQGHIILESGKKKKVDEE